MLHDPHRLTRRALRHVAIVVAQPRQPFRALGERAAFQPRRVLRRLILKGHEQELFRRGGAKKFLRRREQVDGHGIARRREKIMCPLREAVEHQRAADRLRRAPRIEQPALFQIETHAFHPHVTHPQPRRQSRHAQALRALQLIHHPQPRAAAHLLNEALLHGEVES